MNFKLNRLFQLFLLELVGFCLVVSFSSISAESTGTLFMFSLLFSSLTFMLKGSTVKKLSLLALGNAIGLFWNFVFYFFATAGFSLFDRTFNATYTIIYPILNLLWIVPFWSLSLTLLPKMSTVYASGKLTTND